MNKNIFLLSSVLMATAATTVSANGVQTTLAGEIPLIYKKRIRHKPQAMTMA